MMYPLVISTDIGTDIDDAIAVYLAATNPNIDLKSVWVTNGDVQSRACIAQKLLHYTGSRATVLLGESDSLDCNEKPYMLGFESSFLSSQERYRARRWPIQQHGLDAIQRLLQQEAGVYIASIAPMTNLARLIDAYPESQQKIKKVIAMACRIGALEHNIRFDIEAAKRVFDSNLALTIVPGNVCDRYHMDAHDLLSSLHRKKALQFISEMAFTLKQYRERANLVTLIDEMLRNPVQKREGTDEERNQAFVIEQYLKGQFKKRDTESIEETNFLFRALVTSNPAYAEYRQQFHSIESVSFAVHDAYTIFCLIYPEKIKTEQVSLSVDGLGNTTVIPGGPHEIVMDLDYDHFKRFLYTGLQIKKVALPILEHE